MMIIETEILHIGVCGTSGLIAASILASAGMVSRQTIEPGEKPSHVHGMCTQHFNGLVSWRTTKEH
jgi:hypothetical protein